MSRSMRPVSSIFPASFAITELNWVRHTATTHQVGQGHDNANTNSSVTAVALLAGKLDAPGSNAEHFIPGVEPNRPIFWGNS